MLASERPRASTYRLFGLNLSSEIDLAGLAPPVEAGAPDVEIAFGLIASGEDPPGYSATAEGTLLSVAKVGRYLIREGRHIVIDPAPGASERNLRLFLLGSAIGALLHQRGLLPLHANAINIGGRAVAFSGHSGAGKSTIAAWFHDRGYPILADDVCVIGFDDAGRALAYPGIPRLRLWREALEATGRDAGAYDRSFDDQEKYDVPTLSGVRLEPLPLTAIYLLRKADDKAGGGAAIDRLTGVDSVETLISNTYRGGYLRTIGRTGEHLAACLRVARAVPVFCARRQWGFERFEEQARQLHDHACAQPPPG
ncbi:MAG TPA: hypothetical protein VEA61_00310 [Allosphingosinicella sp.]|nr:hypothetical protein [Allosphingosinicella sp.]